MAIIYETNHFIVQSAEAPLVDREDGGHITIDPKIKIAERQALTTYQAIELMRLTLVAGQAMTTVMNRHGVDIGRINYQDNGNWSVFTEAGPVMHIHLYGRAKSAKIQRYGEALHLPRRDVFPELYDKLKPLSKEDVKAIQQEMHSLFNEEKYNDKEWHL